MEIRWKASFSASCLHAVLCAEVGWPAVDDELAQLIAEPAGQLLATINDHHLPVRETLAELVALSSDYENNRQLVEVTLRRLQGAAAVKEEAVSQLAAAIGILETKLLAARPEMVDELALRGRPLQEQWQARGPGLLQQVKRLTEENFLVPAAEIVLVTPWIGGHGFAHLKSNRVTFEAVLANPRPDLPEALRLGWLLAQLNTDLPVYGEAIPADRLRLIAGLATLPVILTAAETVEWGTCSLASIERALECWHILPAPSPTVAAQLWQWWQAYQDGTTSWLVAWRGLEALLR
ncbi:MAG: hypothetical protein SH868_04810 [Bythopirellula sp.]|nr:hypothetical protein [Bythopirellula sp.]